MWALMVFEKYHDIGISLDTDEATLRKFVKENQLPWRQIFDGQKWDGTLVQKYGVRGISAHFFLIDWEGKVISVKARGKFLGELVAAEIAGKDGSGDVRNL